MYLHLVPVSEHLTDLQEGLVLGLRDDQPDVEQCRQADEAEDDETVGAQATLEGRDRYVETQTERGRHSGHTQLLDVTAYILYGTVLMMKLLVLGSLWRRTYRGRDVEVEVER